MRQISAEQPLYSLIQQKWPVAIFAISQAVIFLVIFQGNLYGSALREDFALDYLYSSKIIQGQLPYRDFAVEYPPLAMLFITLPRLLIPTPSAYIWAYAAQILIFDLIGIYLLASISQTLRINKWQTLTIYTLALLATGPLLIFRFDLIPAVVTLASIFFLLKGHTKTAWALLAIGMLIKIFPIILAPIFLIYHIRFNRKKEAIIGTGSLLVTGAILILPALILSPGGLWHSLIYHVQRGLQIESTYASVLELLYAFNIIGLDFSFASGSVNVISPIAESVAKVSLGIMVIGLLLVYWHYYKGLKQPSTLNASNHNFLHRQAWLVNCSLLAILVFILTSKVFSPQYIIWALPFIPLITGQWRNVSWLSFIMVGLMTFFIYPEYYGGIEHGELITVAMLVMRNGVLSIMAILITKTIREEYVEVVNST